MLIRKVTLSHHTFAPWVEEITAKKIQNFNSKNTSQLYERAIMLPKNAIVNNLNENPSRIYYPETNIEIYRLCYI